MKGNLCHAKSLRSLRNFYLQRIIGRRRMGTERKEFREPLLMVLEKTNPSKYMYQNFTRDISHH